MDLVLKTSTARAMSPTSLAYCRLGTPTDVSPVAMRRMDPTSAVTGRAIRNTSTYQATKKCDKQAGEHRNGPDGHLRPQFLGLLDSSRLFSR